jgi:hypothetical protein
MLGKKLKPETSSFESAIQNGSLACQGTKKSAPASIAVPALKQLAISQASSRQKEKPARQLAQ